MPAISAALDIVALTAADLSRCSVLMYSSSFFHKALGILVDLENLRQLLHFPSHDLRDNTSVCPTTHALHDKADDNRLFLALVP